MMLPEQVTDAGPFAATFNATISAMALGAAWRAGVLERLEPEPVLISGLADDLGLRPEVLVALFNALTAAEIVQFSDNRRRICQGREFEAAFAAKGFVYWLTNGCGPMLNNLPALMRVGESPRELLRRDDSAISYACRDIARSFFDPPLRELLADQQPVAMVDLGCGSADRLIMMASWRPELAGTGVDISGAALAVATEAVAEADLSSRITLVRDDVTELRARPEYERADLVTCFLMGHDFWPRDECLATLGDLRKAFPEARSLILGDTARSLPDDERPMPLFTAGFELVHAAMDTYLPTVQEWREVIAESDWYIADERLISVPANSFIFRLAPR